MTTVAPSLHQRTEITEWLRSRFGRYPGLLCIGHIDGDPRFEDMQQTWIDNRKVITAAEHILLLEQQGFNVYVGLCRFNRRTRGYATAQQSVWLWLDDVPLDFDATELIQTSQGSRQAWIRLESPLSAEERSAWQKHIAATVGADQCSADAVHMARAPFGLNTKNHAAFPVQPAGGTGKTYTLADLEACYGTPAPRATAPPRRGTNGSARIDSALFNTAKLAAYRTQLANPRTTLLKDAPESTVSYIQRIPAHVYPGTQTYDLLTNADKRRAWRNKGGSWDASLVRYMITKGLIFVGYDANLIAAFILHLEDPETLNIKGEQAILDDVARIFTDAKLGTLYAQKQAEQRQRRARHDRPQRHTAETYYALLCAHQQDGSVPMKRKERAALAGVSARTLDRLEDVLEQQKYIRIHTPKDRSGSTVELLRGVVNIVAEADDAPAEPTGDVPDEVLSGTHDAAPELRILMPETASDGVMHKEHTAPTAPAGRGAPPPEPPAPSLVQVVQEALESYPDAGRRRLKAVMAHAALHGYGDADAVKRVYQQETDAFRLERRKLRQLPSDELAKVIRARQRALTRNIGKPREGYWRVMLDITNAEHHRRGLPDIDALITRPPTLPRPPRAARPPAAPQARAGVSLCPAPAPEQLPLAAPPAPDADVLTAWAQTYTTGYVVRFIDRLKARTTVTA